MHIKVRKKHIKLGEPKAGKDPLSLAFQEALGLSEWSVRITPCSITLLDFNGRTRYSRKMPEEGKKFLINYYKYMFGEGKKPKPVTIYVEPVDYIIEKVNLLRQIADEINNWSGNE